MIQRAGPDAIVVGAGIVGAACAAALARDGWRVTVLDRSFAAAGTTSVGMGHIVVMDDTPEQLALTAYSAQLWRDLRPQLDARSEFDACGTLWIAEDESQRAALEEKRTIYRAARVAADVIDGPELRESEPNLRDDLLGALLVPDDAVIYPPGATIQLLELARRNGAIVREGVEVREVIANGVRLPGETLHADVVINAAGAAAPALTSGLPILPRKGHLAITDRYPGLCRHQIVELGYLTSAHAMTSESVAFNVQPRSTGQILIGSSRELVGWDATLNHAVLGRMLARATELMPALRDVSIIRSWTGFRPATPDKLPLIGRWEPMPGVWIAGGHEGLGITMSLATAELIADEIAGRAPQIDAAPFSPMRVLSQPLSGSGVGAGAST
jgi:glycine/D-amino acid oxidase-like deaminating enzyme